MEEQEKKLEQEILQMANNIGDGNGKEASEKKMERESTLHINEARELKVCYYPNIFTLLLLRLCTYNCPMLMYNRKQYFSYYLQTF